MTSVEEQTLYDVLEVEPRATVEEIRAAHARAAETFGPESIAVYALVDEEQVDALRDRLAEAAEVLLDPARRASYDRSIGLAGPGTLWEEDAEDAEEALAPVEREPDELEEPVGPGPHALAAEAALASPGDDAPPPEQRALDLDLVPAPGPFGRGIPEQEADQAPPGSAEGLPETAPAPVTATAAAPAPAEPPPESAPALHEDWAAAVAEPAPAPPEAPPSAPPIPDPPVPSPRRPPPPLPRSALGLRRPASAVPREGTAHAAQGGGEGAVREGRARLDIHPEAEFNGELLRQVRESHGLSLQQVSERTRITRIHLENVEADRYDRLPTTVYLRGILVNLARELRLDPARVSKSYLLVAQRAQTRGHHD
jgi:Helix-turn-helix domain/DnaJ domain